MLKICSSQIRIFFLLLLFCVQLSVQISLNEYLTLSHAQKLKLDEFRERMIHRVPHEYMKQDIYLIRWLRDRDFDIASAQEKLLKHLLWRKETDMDNILNEDWSDFDYDFKISVEGCDLDSKPIISMRVGDWDIRRHILAGKLQKLIRYVDKVFEDSENMLRKMRAQGQNATQATMIFELSNFNLVEQGCARCVPVLYHIAKTYTENFVGTAHKIISVNTPQIAIPIWEIVKSFLSPQLRDILVIYGKDTSEWKTALFSEINENQLSRPFGGTKPEALDFQDLRTTGEIIRCAEL